jgi:hypothetical protein
VIDQLKTTTPRYVAVSAALLTAIGFGIGGKEVGIGAAVGGLVAVVDAWAIIWLVTQIISGSSRVGRGIAVALLSSKLVILLAVCWVLLARLAVHPAGFALGLGALVLGMLYAGAKLSMAEAQATREG